jgi:large subunit ribosomal protein L11
MYICTTTRKHLSSSTPLVQMSKSASILKLIIPAGSATPSPPIGPALGQRGVKAIDFCKQFNEASTKSSTPFQPGTPLQCRILCKADKSFSFAVKPPTTSWLLKRAAGLQRASSDREVARLPVQMIFEVARIKAKDPQLTGIPLKRIFEMVVASAKSYGISII